MHYPIQFGKRAVVSVYMHHLLEVDADPAPVPWGAECALSAVCCVGHEEQEIIKIPSGTKTIGQMDRTKEKENMHGKEAEEPFQEAQSPLGWPKPDQLSCKPAAFGFILSGSWGSWSCFGW